VPVLAIRVQQSRALRRELEQRGFPQDSIDMAVRWATEYDDVANKRASIGSWQAYRMPRSSFWTTCRQLRDPGPGRRHPRPGRLPAAVAAMTHIETFGQEVETWR
jgi:hypothetical protein